MAKYDIPDGHWNSTGDDGSDDDDDETSEPPRVDVRYQTIKILWRTEPRDLEYGVVISVPDPTSDYEHEEEVFPLCSHASRAHRLSGSNQFDPMGSVQWHELPAPVQYRVVDLVAGVEDRDELDPRTYGFGRPGGEGDVRE